MVDDAIAAGRDGNILARTVRGLTGEDVDEDVEPQSRTRRAAVSGWWRACARETDRAPRDAEVEFAATASSSRRHARAAQVDAATCASGRARAHAPGPRRGRSRARVRKPRPKVTTEDLAEKYDTLVDDRPRRLPLRLFKRLKLVKTYPIAVGQVGLETPAGLYNVQNKAVNPAWNVPELGLGGRARRAASSRAACRRTRSRRAGWASTTAPASTAPTRSARSGRTPRTAASACSSRTSSSCTTRCPSGAPVYIA